jgi:hypothetical protein
VSSWTVKEQPCKVSTFLYVQPFRTKYGSLS